MMERPSCPRCGSEHVTGGVLVPGGRSVAFLSDDVQVPLLRQILTVVDGAVATRERPMACVDCGLVWTTLDAPTLRDKLRRLGSEDRLQRLGIDASGEMAPADAPTGRGDEPSPSRPRSRPDPDSF
jgi:hypothetical protein